ncbi:D-glycero-beta-D-manno-heptose-7-phosphate kinase [Candidatus Woesearchaeota archaeon]|nr:D-glycero-beta-D-manno-heptose-7-phosphate kinase [Candidatus Woesearchaeota archaeon]
MMNSLIKIIDKFKDRKILVLGDIMLDKYIWGDVSRISPEAPVQVVNVLKETYAPGGAANVANNLASFNSKSFMVGTIGKGDANNILINELKKRKIDVNGIFIDSNRPTIQKVRIIARSQQLLRVDYEKKNYVDANIENKILNFISGKINGIDAVIVSDYAKGVVTKQLMEKLTALCKNKGKMVVVDPKPQHKKFYKNATIITPNHSEAHQMTGFAEEEISDRDIERMGKKLLKDLNSNVLITKGEKGMSLFEKNMAVTHIPTFAKEVYDVTGAGDTVVASLCLALTSGASFKQAAIIANHAAGITVGKIGTSTVNIDELKKSIENG